MKNKIIDIKNLHVDFLSNHSKTNAVKNLSIHINENEIFGKSLMIAIAYSASIGGMATLIGTPPNMVLAGVVEESYGIKLNMFDWMKFGVPLSSFLLIICWFYLTKIAFKFKNEEFSAGQDEIHRQIKNLGNFSNEEIKVLIVFTLTALGWIFRGRIETIFPIFLSIEE